MTPKHHPKIFSGQICHFRLTAVWVEHTSYFDVFWTFVDFQARVKFGRCAIGQKIFVPDQILNIYPSTKNFMPVHPIVQNGGVGHGGGIFGRFAPPLQIPFPISKGFRLTRCCNASFVCSSYFIETSFFFSSILFDFRNLTQ